MGSKYPNLGILDAIIDTLDSILYDSSRSYADREELFQRVGHNFPGSKTQFGRKLFDLRKGGFIAYDNKQRVAMTKKGEKRLDMARFIQLEWRDKKHDGLFRLIMFDIPEKRRGARDLLRGKLQSFGCYQIQKSVYVTAYQCEKIMEKILRYLHLEKLVHVAVATHLGHDDAKIRRYFSNR